ncbi:MAG TPA: universal stress protein [Desulfosarcina sp.]|nr:universal stress protein [Desulfosarcina sp.]
MFRKILYPTDFSDVAEKALDYIKRLNVAGGREVIILHVINRRIIDGLLRHGMLEKDIEKWRAKAAEVGQETLAQMRRQLEYSGFTVRTLIKTGYPSQVILDVEKKELPSIIVIGSHGRSNLGDMLLGSVSDRVIRKSTRPVLVVKRDDEQ